MSKKITTAIISLLLIFLFVSCSEKYESDAADEKPNILLIVVDDMGYSDVGAFGGEINTPAIDKLAEQGIMLTNFHVMPTCSPTRSVLMSGTDNHIAGMGAMGEILSDKQKGQPGYEGYLNDRVAHLPKIMKDAGYRTYMSGKWHLGHEKEHSPYARGFDETFTLIPGGGSHYADMRALSLTQPMLYRRNGEVVKSLPDDFYSTRNYTDYLIEWLNRDKENSSPFFAYLSYTAPHDPLHAPKEYIKKYKGKYDEGYNVLREKRLKKLIQLGILDEKTSMPPWGGLPEWEQLNEDHKKESARDMEVYAAMIDYMDEQIARVFEWLEKEGLMDNTLIIFFSDNGANGAVKSAYPGMTKEFENSFDNSLSNRGLSNSFIEMGPAWASASMAPRRLFKSFTSEGGILSPCIIKLPEALSAKKDMVKTFTHVSDIMPTFIELSGAKHPGADNPDIPGMIGKSLIPLLTRGISDQKDSRNIGYELHGLRAYFSGDWKILNLPKPFGTGDWELFNLTEDPGESNDLSEDNPEKLSELVKAYDEYEKEVGVIFDPIDMSIISKKEE